MSSSFGTVDRLVFARIDQQRDEERRKGKKKKKKRGVEGRGWLVGGRLRQRVAGFNRNNNALRFPLRLLDYKDKSVIWTFLFAGFSSCFACWQSLNDCDLTARPLCIRQPCPPPSFALVGASYLIVIISPRKSVLRVAFARVGCVVVYAKRTKPPPRSVDALLVFLKRWRGRLLTRKRVEEGEGKALNVGWCVVRIDRGGGGLFLGRDAPSLCLCFIQVAWFENKTDIFEGCVSLSLFFKQGRTELRNFHLPQGVEISPQNS